MKKSKRRNKVNWKKQAIIQKEKSEFSRKNSTPLEVELYGETTGEIPKPGWI